MERKHLLDKISDCLSSNGSQKDINKLCRDYLNENVQNKDVKDIYIKEILMSLANHFSVVLDYEVVNDKTYVNKNKSKNNKRLLTKFICQQSYIYKICLLFINLV